LSSQHPTPPPDPYSLSLHDALPISIILSTHDVGGARAGDDPENSVLDKHLLTHEIPNLAVLGGAGFASVAGYNPTETIEAYAWLDRKSTRLNSSHVSISYAVFCLQK